MKPRTVELTRLESKPWISLVEKAPSAWSLLDLLWASDVLSNLRHVIQFALQGN
jgi:hypothetical protein